MATIYGAKVAVPAGQTLNLRKEANAAATVLYRPSSGTSLNCDSIISNVEWITVTSMAQTCYGMRKFIDTSTISNPSAANLFGGVGSSNNIRQSSTKKAVVFNLQWALKRLGFDPNGIDGIFGGGTLTAVENYQRSKGWTPDGIVGDQTKAALVADLS